MLRTRWRPKQISKECQTPHPAIHVPSCFSLDAAFKVDSTVHHLYHQRDYSGGGWPLLKIANFFLTVVDSKGTNEGVLPWLVRGFVMSIQDMFVLPWQLYSA